MRGAIKQFSPLFELLHFFPQLREPLRECETPPVFLHITFHPADQAGVKLAHDISRESSPLSYHPRHSDVM